MSNSFSLDDGSLPRSVYDRVETLVQQFRSLWEQGELPSIEAFLEQLPDHAVLLLPKLLEVEVAARHRCGTPLPKYRYLERFPWFSDEITRLLNAPSAGQPDELCGDMSTDHLSMGAAERPNKSLQTTHSSGSGVPRESETGRHLPEIDGYEVLAELGHGGMGVVYRAIDSRRGQVVALKMMTRVDAEHLSRFKREFRTLADIHHENLAKLYKLVVSDHACFFTMELVEGVELAETVRRDLGSDGGLSAQGIARLIAYLRQITAALIKLHDSGKVHRDIKPSNIMVTGSDRVVVLDFGLAIDVQDEHGYQTLPGHTPGTPAYMSPEQAAGEAIRPSSDWYALGVLIHQLLTGKLPFGGSAVQMMMAKQVGEPTAPGLQVSGVPLWLDRLCLQLLSRDPRTRPAGHEILEALGEQASIPPAVFGQQPFVGRQAELTLLDEASAALRDRRSTAVLIRGRSGCGKSTLLTHFLADLRRDDDILVLASRCYGHEAVPFKAVDELIDNLARYLCGLADEQADRVLPSDVAALAKVFPVLEQVEAVRRAPDRDNETTDRQKLRARAFAALRELFLRLGDRQRVVVVIDDLHWSDEDSTSLLQHLLAQPGAPFLLFIGMIRDEATQPNVPTTLVDRLPWDTVLDLDCLDAQACEDLAEMLLPPLVAGIDRERMRRQIAAESLGNPLFLRELVLAASKSAGEYRSDATLTLDQMLWSRVEALSDAPRQLLQSLAVAGVPMAESTLRGITRLPPEQFSDAVIELRGAHLLRDCNREPALALDTYHDRVRETIIAHWDHASLEAMHRQIGEHCEADGGHDAHFLALHYQAAGVLDKAFQYSVKAADEAVSKLAFHQAARLYEDALSLKPLPVAEAVPLRLRLADALAHGGRSLEAAEQYLVAAAEADDRQALDARRKAFELFQFMGRINRAQQIFGDVCHHLGASYPSSLWTALLLILYYHLKLDLTQPLAALRQSGNRTQTVDAGRLDAYWSIATSMTHLDYVRGATFSTQHLLLATQLGEPRRLARALALEASQISALGRLSVSKSSRLIQKAEVLAEKYPDAHVDAVIDLCKGIQQGCSGQWPQAFAHCSQAESNFLRLQRDVQYNQSSESHGFFSGISIARVWQLYALTWIGDINKLDSLSHEHLAIIEGEHDKSALLMIGGHSRTYSHIARGRTQDAMRDLQHCVDSWDADRFLLQQMMVASGYICVSLYAGDTDGARNRLQDTWSRCRKSYLLGPHMVRSHLRDLAVRASLATAAETADRRRWLRSAWRCQALLACERMAWTTALATGHRACLAWFRGNRSKAQRLFGLAEDRFDACGMRLHRAACRLRGGQIADDARGEQQAAEAARWMTEQGVADVDTMAHFLLPGPRQ